jgi:hypothetical protein
MAVNLGQFFNALHQAPAPASQPQQPQQQAQPQQNPSFWSSLWGGNLASQTSAQAVQGAADRFSAIFAQNQDEITNRVRDIFQQALLRRCPENYHRLMNLIQTFLNQQTSADLQQIKQLLSGLNAAEIRAMAPNINDAGVSALTTLRALLDAEVTEEPPLTMTANAGARLQAARAILAFIIQNHEGAVVQTLNFVTQNLSDPNGPMHQVQQQLGNLRGAVNARVDPRLRQSRDALENYRGALQRNVTVAEITPLMQILHEKLTLLLTNRAAVPQITPQQWTALEQFDLQLTAPFASHAANLGASETPIQIVAGAFNAQRGVVEETADVVVDAIGRGMAHFETLPNRMLQNLFPSGNNNPAPAATGAPGTTAAAAPAVQGGGNPINLNAIVDRGSRFLDSILSSAGSAFAQQASRQLATMARYIFDRIREHIQNTPEQNHLLQTIDPMIQRLQGAIDRGSWDELTGVLRDAFRFIQEQQVYLQGLRLPLNTVRSHVSAIPPFLRNIDAHENSLRAQRAPQTITDRDIASQATFLKAKASSKGLAFFILEKICGFKANNAGYGRIYATAGITEKNASTVFRKRLFAKINQAQVGLFSGFIKWSAKIIYDLFLPISSFFVNSTIDNMLKMAREGISGPLQEKIVKIARNWLAVTSGAYNDVASSPYPEAKDFPLMMENALRAPARNGGLTPKQLYTAATTTAIDTFGPRLKFNEAIDRYFSTQNLTNPLVVLFNRICSFLLKGLVFIPQWLGNFAIKSCAKIGMKFTPLLQETSESTIESLRKNTPASYAAKKVLYRQLQKVLQILQRNLNEEGAEGRETNIQKVEIANLVDYLLEVLNKSQYHTQDRLKDYLGHHAPLRDRAARELEDTFIPEVMEHIVKILSTSLQAATQEDELKQMLYDGLSIANNSFEDAEPVTDQEFTVLEKGIKEMADQILETAIFYAVDEKFDFTNEKQKRGITQFMQTMKVQSGSFARQINRVAGEIAQNQLNGEALMEKVTSMVNHSAQFSRQRVDALGKADGNRNFHTETKYHLNELSRNLLAHCNPITRQLSGIKKRADRALYFDKLIRPLSLSSACNRTLAHALQNPRLLPQDVTTCNAQHLQLLQHLAVLRQNRCPDPLASEIQRSIQELGTSLQKTQEAQKADEILRALYPLFNQLILDKQRNSSSSVLKQNERKLRELINTLPSVDQKNRLNRQVNSIMAAQSRETIEQQGARFRSLYVECNSQNSIQENTHFHHMRRSQQTLHNRLNGAIEDFTAQFNTQKTIIQSSSNALIPQIDALNTWSQAQHDLPLLNLFVFDMQWATETVKNLAFDRAQSKIKQLFESLYQKHNYIGLVNQGVLLPFLEKFGKHHLKK